MTKTKPAYLQPSSNIFLSIFNLYVADLDEELTEMKDQLCFVNTSQSEQMGLERED